MSRLNPIQVVLHCGLHKTGSTYIQRNLQTNKQILLENGILYIGPKILRKNFPQIWIHMEKQKPIKSAKQKRRLKQQMQRIETQLPATKNNDIHTILISSEAIFGKLRDGFKPRGSKHKNGEGIYRYARKRSSLLLSAIESSFQTKPSKYKILYINRDQHSFAKSCYAQLIKEGQKNVGQMDFDTFALTSDFSRASDAFIKRSLSRLKPKYKLKIISMDYDATVNHNKPSDLLWKFLEKALPKKSKKIKNEIISDSYNSNLDKIHNPGLNEKGLLLARLSLHILNKHERKKFRRFLEKRFNKSNHSTNQTRLDHLRIRRHQFSNKNAINERGKAIESHIRPHLNAEEQLIFKNFLRKHYPEIN